MPARQSPRYTILWASGLLGAMNCGAIGPLQSAFVERFLILRLLAQIVDKLKTLTLLEAAELVKEIETTFGVDAR